VAGALKIAVLLSTFNGEAFLRRQLDSLAAQEAVTVEVFARDDGSTDRTLAVLRDYAHLWPRLVEPIAGERLGPAGSFLALLESAPPGFDGYAFCDQDDVWLPDKLARAAARLGETQGQPTLYCSAVLCVDPDQKPLGPKSVNGDTRFAHLLFENIAYGNTVVMNESARQAITARAPKDGVIMHDWWCALVVSALGRLIFDPRPGVLYRQHGANSIGASPRRSSELASLAKGLWRNPRGFYPIHAQAREFLRLFGDQLGPDQTRLARALVASRRSVTARVGFAVSAEIPRSDTIGALAARLLIAAGLY
jgi:glycosyltransferase involved in cell wall biosynthesis